MTRLKYHDDVLEIIRDAYQIIDIPEMAINIPLSMSKFALVEVDEEGNETDAGFACVQDLYDIFGKQYTKQQGYAEGRIKCRWSFDEDEIELTTTKEQFVSLGLVDIRPKGTSMADVEFTNNGNEFIIYQKREAKYVPRVETELI